MSDKAMTQTEKDFWVWWDLAQEAETSPIEIWQAAHEMYAPKEAQPSTEQEAEPVASVPQGLEEWIAKHEFIYKNPNALHARVVYSQELREFMASMESQ